MKKIFYLLLMLSTSFFAKSKFVVKDIDKQITTLTYNLQVETADSLIQEQKTRLPNSPKYYLLEIGNELMRTVVLTEAALTERKQIIKDSMNTVTLNLAQAAADKFEDIEMTLENKFYMGGIHGYLGRFYGMEGSWMSAFTNGKRGKNLLEEVIEEDPEFYDAYLLLGMFYYYGDRMGGVIGLIASILGFSGDRAEGIKCMEISANNGILTSPQAKMLLAELYSRLEDNDFKAAYWFEVFIKDHPKNYHMVNWYLRETLTTDMAYRCKQLVEEDNYQVVDPLCKGTYYFKLGQYITADKYLNQFLANKDKFWRYYQRSGMLNLYYNNFMIDKNSENKLPERLSQTEKQMIKDISLYPEVYKNLFEFSSLVSKNENPDQIKAIISSREEISPKRIEGLYLFEIGKFYFFQDDYKQAAQYFMKARDYNPDWLTYATSKFLIESYLLFDAEIEQVENLIDIIDDLDSEPLEWSAKDLEIKYDL